MENITVATKTKHTINQERKDKLTSICSLVNAYSSMLTMADLMVLGGGRTVSPMLIAFERFTSNR